MHLYVGNIVVYTVKPDVRFSSGGLGNCEGLRGRILEVWEVPGCLGSDGSQRQRFVTHFVRAKHCGHFLLQEAARGGPLTMRAKFVSGNSQKSGNKFPEVCGVFFTQRFEEVPRGLGSGS